MYDNAKAVTAYLHGETEKAAVMFLEGAREGDIFGAFNYAYCLWRGIGVEKDAAGYVTEWNITVLESGELLFSPVYATSLVLGRQDLLSQKLGFVDDASAENAKFVIEKTELDYTGIETEVTVERDNAKIVYDIYGRCVECVTAPGFYIIDGRKVYIRP